MIDLTLFRDTFEYFARFPMRSGVLKSFNLEESSLFADEYPAFKAQIENMEEHSLLPDIENYVFGVNREIVIKRVKEFTGFYLFVDYGNLSTERDERRVKTDSLMIAISVAIPRDPASMDNVESLLIGEKALDLMGKITNRMIADSRNSPYVQRLSFPNETTPFFAPELENSTGFTKIFSSNHIDLFGS